MLAMIPAQVRGQVAERLPAYAPLNPVIASRSVLAALPFRDPVNGWSLQLSLDYGNAAEIDVHAPARYVLDAEIARAQLSATRDFGDAWFISMQTGVVAVHAGFADAFFDSFHRLIRYDQAARANLPRNEFAYRITLDASESIERAPADPSLEDARLLLGRRHGAHLQSVLALTLPTSTAPAGYGRQEMSAALINTVRWVPHRRALAEGTLSAGYTPTHGELAAFQHTTMYSLSAALRLDVWRAVAVYGIGFYHSPIHHDIALSELALGERTIDFGALITTRAALWRISLVEETRASDGAIDLILRLGASWQPLNKKSDEPDRH